jgi:hypothetical protein
MEKHATRWAASLALLLPVILFYLAECLRGDGRTFTGFIQADQPSYMADARAYFQGGFHLFYGNPYSPDPDTPRIYFQIHLLLLGIFQRLTGWDPGVVYVLFGFVAGVVCIRVAMALYEELAGLRSTADWLGLVLFIWGGGVLELMGLACHVLAPGGGGIFTDVLAFDPMEGWWFLNVGRNLVYPTESYYHALAFGLILVTLRGNFRAAIALGLVLALSHPFTGLEMLLAVTVWGGVESMVLKNRAVPFLFAGTMAYLVFVHLLYYVVVLNMFTEHRVVFAQWSLAWTESALTALGADFLVGLLAFWAVRSRELAREVFSQPGARLLAAWFVVALILVHHDLFFPPKQPLHFTHGYTWAALFLLGAKPLRRLLESILAWRAGVRRWAALALIFGLGLSDNVLWFGFQATASLTTRWGWFPGHAFALDAADRDLFRWLRDRPEPHTEVLICTDPSRFMVYLGITYTDYRGWAPHNATTPYAVLRKREVTDFIEKGTPAPGWKGKAIMLILPKSQTEAAARYGVAASQPLFENSEYRAYRIEYR